MFLNVSSSCLLEQMHSRIVCICMLFLQSEFSNAFSKRVSKQRQSHTAFIRASLSCYPENIRTHIGHTCNFFASVSFQMGFQRPFVCGLKVTLAAHMRLLTSMSLHYMCLQIAWVNRCIVTLAAFVRLFSGVSFYMCL